jgi:hypothetical protein
VQKTVAPLDSATTGAPAAAIPVPSSTTRVQRYGASLALRVPTPDGVSKGVQRALRITTSLGGHPTSVHASSKSRSAHADLVLKIPRANVQRAITQLSQLGTITGEQVDVQDLQAGLDATGRTIDRLQKKLTELRALAPTPEIARQIGSLTARVAQLQQAQANTIRTAHFATVRVHIATPAAKAAVAAPKETVTRCSAVYVTRAALVDRHTFGRSPAQVFVDGPGGGGPSDQQRRSRYNYDADHDSISFCWSSPGSIPGGLATDLTRMPG